MAAEITREIRTASLKRNRELSEALGKAEAPMKAAAEAIENGINAVDKSRISYELTTAQKSVSCSSVSDESGTFYQDIAFDELDMLIGKMKGTQHLRQLIPLMVSQIQKSIFRQNASSLAHKKTPPYLG